MELHCKFSMRRSLKQKDLIKVEICEICGVEDTESLSKKTSGGTSFKELRQNESFTKIWFALKMPFWIFLLQGNCFGNSIYKLGTKSPRVYWENERFFYCQSEDYILQN